MAKTGKHNSNKLGKQLMDKDFIPESAEVVSALNTSEKVISDDFDIELSSNEPIRELFTPKNVRFKTQLTEEQRGAVSILYHAYMQAIERGINYSGLKQVLDQYIDFGVSVDRKSREEYVESHKSQMMNQMMQNQMNKPNNIENMKM
jgi:hypothetical protein